MPRNALEWTSTGPEDTAAFGRRLGARAEAGDAVLLDGPIGAGKTVLAGGVLDGLGVPGPHPSPTFILVRAYHGRLPVAHVDLYRLRGAVRADDIGWDELCDGGVLVVEWAERLGALAPEDALHIRLTPGAGSAVRTVTCRATGAASGQLLERCAP